MSVEMIQIAKIIEAEASVLPYIGKVAVAQCILDNGYDFSLFANPTNTYSEDSLKAAVDVFQNGIRRFPDKKLLQFRSFAKYGKNGEPDFEKIYQTMSSDLIYLGKDSLNEWGHFYFGKDEEEMEKKNFKLLLIAGHGDGDCGACGNGYQEADLTRELVGLIATDGRKKGLSVTVADTAKNWYKFLKNGGSFDFSKFDYVLEVHFNAGGSVDTKGDGKKKGSMFFIHPKETGWSVENKILKNLYNLGSCKAWDGVVKSTANYKGGLLVQNRVKAQGVSHGLLETCFISDKDDIAWYQAKKAKIAAAVIDGIVSGFGLAENKKEEKPTFTPYKVRVSIPDLNIRKGAGVANPSIGYTGKGTFTIVAEALGTIDNKGNTSRWGLLKAYESTREGWICLDYATRV